MFRYQTTLTSRRAFILMALSWLHSVLWAVAPAVGWGEIVYDHKTNTCRTSWGAKGLGNKLYAMLLGLFAFIIPTVVLIYCYVKIFKVARRQVELIKRTTVHMQTNENRSVKPSQDIDASESKALKTVLLVLGAFIFAWLPYTVISLGKLATRGSWDVSATWSNAALTITLLNGCVNPFIYAVKDSRLRKGLNKLRSRVFMTSPDVLSSTQAASVGPKHSQNTVPTQEITLASFQRVDE